MSIEINYGVIYISIICINIYCYGWLMILVDEIDDGKVHDGSMVTLFKYLTRNMNIIGKLIILSLMLIPIFYTWLLNLIYFIVKNIIFRRKKDEDKI